MNNIENSMNTFFKTDEIITNTELSRNHKKLDKILEQEEKAVVFNRNKPEAVILKYEVYEDLIEKLDNALIQILALLPDNDRPENRYDENNIGDLFKNEKDNA